MSHQDSSHSTPSATPEAPAPKAGLMAAQPVTILLKHPATKGFDWVLRFFYLAVLWVIYPVMAIVVLSTMPLGVGPEHPRRALHLWATGMVATGMGLTFAHSQVKAMGGFSLAFEANPTAAVGLGVMVVALLVNLFYLLSWVKSER